MKAIKSVSETTSDEFLHFSGKFCKQKENDGEGDGDGSG